MFEAEKDFAKVLLYALLMAPEPLPDFWDFNLKGRESLVAILAAR